MTKEFRQVVWNDQLRTAWDHLLQIAMHEDLDEAGDWTTRALVPEDSRGRAAVVARRAGVLAGEPAVETTLKSFDSRLRWLPQSRDGQPVVAGQTIGLIEGPARGLLAVERPLLNFLGRLSGIATLTRKYVDAVAGTDARIYDTRKTTPGWRQLEKYAVRCGGAWNHRTGLFEAVLIKDNHLAFRADLSSGQKRPNTPSEAVTLARRFLQSQLGPAGNEMIVEIEVDTLDQLDQVLPTTPDIILLDNMSLDELREAVVRRNAFQSSIQLEASGGVDLDTVRKIAQTGVDRISVGALTHSAVSLDFGLDWQPIVG